MKTFISDLIPKIKRFSQKVETITSLLNQEWVIADDSSSSKVVLIFTDDNKLYYSDNGKTKIGNWRYLGNDSLYIEINGEGSMFKNMFLFNNEILVLKLNNNNCEYLMLFNELKVSDNIDNVNNALKYPNFKYLSDNSEEEELFESFDDLIPIQDQNGLFGFKDFENKIIVNFKYHGAYKFREGLSRVFVTKNNNDYYGFIDKNGLEVVPPTYEYALCFQEGLSLIRLDNKLGFINNQNEVVIPINFDDANSFVNGKAKVRCGMLTYYIDKDGNVISDISTN